MANHQLNVTISLDAWEERAIANAVGCTNPDEFGELLAAYGAAALREFADMLAGQPMGNATEMRERRLVAILLALPPERFPSDGAIARMFSLTPGMARSLMRTTISRHRNRLEAVLDAAARRFLAVCGEPDEEGDREPRFASALVVEMLNERLVAEQQDHAYRPIRRKAGTFDTYVIANGSYLKLVALYQEGGGNGE